MVPSTQAGSQGTAGRSQATGRSFFGDAEAPLRKRFSLRRVSAKKKGDMPGHIAFPLLGM
jgi:hypothetical protein